MELPGWLWAGWEEEFTLTNLVLIVVALMLIRNILSPTAHPEPRKEPQIAQRDYTLEELRAFDGNTPSAEHFGDKPIYLALAGAVFDVTAGRTFYGPPDGPYSVLAGRDATRALATMELDKVSDTFEDHSGLSKEELGTLRDWVEQFSAKYPVRGKLVEKH